LFKRLRVSNVWLKAVLIVIILSLILSLSACNHISPCNPTPQNSTEPYQRTHWGEPRITAMIAEEYPEINDPNLHEEEIVNILRAWCHEHIVWFVYSGEMNAQKQVEYLEQGSYELFQAFERNEGGVWCQGTAQAFSLLCKDFGFYSYIIGVGWSDIFTHAVTVVEVDGRRTIQDATFDITYMLGDHMASCVELFDMLKNNNRDNIWIKYGASKPTWFTYPSEEIGHNEGLTFPLVGEIVDCGNGYVKQRGLLTYDRFMVEYLDKIAVRLWEEGYPANPIFMLVSILYSKGDGLCQKALK